MPLILPDSTNHPTLVSDTQYASDQALQALSADTIVHEIKRLRNSVERLRQSNDQIQEFCSQETQLPAAEKDELNQACQDNLVTISKQETLVARLASVLASKTGGSTTVPSHYGIQAPSDSRKPTSESQAGTQRSQEDMQVDEAEQGVFL